MEIIAIVAVGLLVYLFGKGAIGGISGVTSGVTTPATTQNNAALVNQNLNAGFATTQTIASSSISVGTSAVSTIAKSLGVAGPALSAIPIVGAAFAAVASILLAASKKRAQEATSENQAVDAALPAWDAAIQQAVQLFNNGSITQQQVGLLLGTPRSMKYYNVPVGQCWQNFWNEVGPQVQPGRNGCKSGTVTQPGDNPPTLPQGTSFCTGDYGAGCCVAYGDMDNSMGNPNNGDVQGGTPGQMCVFGALKAAVASPGTPFVATILKIASSKYSTYSRAQYTVTFTAPAS
jgi:hypothetical protein